MKISEALKQAKIHLTEIEGNALDSMLLLMHATSFSKEKIVFNPDLELNETQKNNFFQFVERRKNREPVSHLLGKREFFGREFLVNSNVLDPRPDSEILIELALKYAAKNLQILELGVGSGCLIVTLLAELPEAVGIGVDLSEKALEIAQKNAEKNNISNRLQLLKSDLFSSLKNAEKFDLLISNPPYIPSTDIENLQDEVKFFEPRMALDGGADGYDFYRRIAAEAKSFLQQNGAIIVEIGFGQAEKICEIFTEKNFQLIESKRDLAGIERALCFKNISQK